MRNIFFRAVLLLSTTGMLLGCDRELPLRKLPTQLILETYKPTGELAGQQSITKDDHVYQRLEWLLGSEKTGWQQNYISYKTGPFIFRSENLIIRCYSDLMIIDITNSGHSSSLKKGLPRLLQKLGLPESGSM